MTLPFRRRHHDDEGGHERARGLISDEMLEPLGDDESAWLSDHLAACAGCQGDREAYRADRDLLRSLRDRSPEPPRDLWARTSAALDREAGRPRAATRLLGGGGRGRAGWRGLPLGAAAGALIVLVVIGTSVVWPPLAPSVTPGHSLSADATLDVVPTPITVAAKPVEYIRPAADGSWALFSSDVDTVCPRSEPQCRPQLDDGPARPVRIQYKPSSVAISPESDQLVIESGEAFGPGRILVVPVSTTPPPATPAPSALPETDAPTTDPSASPEATPVATPSGQVEIATGVRVVGDVAYSGNGSWLAFSARPIDDSTGPDLYIWSVGTPSAIAVTTDHQTYFSAWLGDQVIASRIDIPAPTIPADPGASGDPAATQRAEPVVAHATSFVLDPTTLERTDFTQPDVWLPVVDPTARFVAYWSGTLQSVDGLTWAPGPGQLVLDGWSSGVDEPAEPAASADTGASVDPAASAGPVFGPTGAGIAVVTGPVGAFKARFDPDAGTRLAIWVAEQPSDTVGRLHLLVLDVASGAIAADSPLRGVPALQRFSIELGRLAWVSPSGQDGQESAVKVLGWSGNAFGEIETHPGRDLFIVR